MEDTDYRTKIYKVCGIRCEYDNNLLHIKNIHAWFGKSESGSHIIQIFYLPKWKIPWGISCLKCTDGLYLGLPIQGMKVEDIIKEFETTHKLFFENECNGKQ